MMRPEHFYVAVLTVTSFAFLTFASRSHSRKSHWLLETVPDFVCTRFLPDGEIERRIHWGRISAVETAVELPPAAPQSGLRKSSYDYAASPTAYQEEIITQGLTLRQVTDGRHFIQLIYDSGWELRDCEYLRDFSAVDDFFRSFTDEPGCKQYLKHRNGSAESCCKAPASSSSIASLGNHNFTLQLLPRGEPLISDLALLTDYRALREQCHALHRRVREAVRQQSARGTAALQRLKRDLFLYPGTNWCGSGSNARKFNELGYNAAADRCCRDHDHCPNTIEGFTNKYNFFNFRFHTISHCDCDERFRACLKLSSTAAGNMVGKLFFNVVQTKCFLFKDEKTCAKRSWWGKCLKHEKQQIAFLRDALTY